MANNESVLIRNKHTGDSKMNLQVAEKNLSPIIYRLRDELCYGLIKDLSDYKAFKGNFTHYADKIDEYLSSLMSQGAVLISKDDSFSIVPSKFGVEMTGKDTSSFLPQLSKIIAAAVPRNEITPVNNANIFTFPKNEKVIEMLSEATTKYYRALVEIRNKSVNLSPTNGELVNCILMSSSLSQEDF